MKVEFHKQEDSRAGKVFLVLDYESGDADGNFPEEEELENIKFSENLEVPEELASLINNYKIVKKLDVQANYTDIKEEWGKEIADLWEKGSNDPQVDYQFKCSLDKVFLRGYDNKGTMYETYDL